MKKSNSSQSTNLKRIMAQALNAVSLDPREVEKLLKDEKKTIALKNSFEELIRSINTSLGVNHYTEEKVERYSYYPNKWKVPALPNLQREANKLFPDLKFLPQLPLRRSRRGFDGIAPIPKILSLGRILGIEDPYGDGYCEIVDHLLRMIQKRRSLEHFCWDREHMRRDIRINPCVRPKLESIEQETPGDYLFQPISFGELYACYSARNARQTALGMLQLPLGAAHVACLLLLMPKRLGCDKDLFVLCPGDQCRSHDFEDGVNIRRFKDGLFGCPLFSVQDDYLDFSSEWACQGSCDSGSAIAYLGP